MLDAFDKIDFRRLQHDIHKLYLAGQGQLQRQDSIVARRARQDRRKKIEEDLATRAHTTESRDRRPSHAPTRLSAATATRTTPTALTETVPVHVL